jgi:hypothetical protein
MILPTKHLKPEDSFVVKGAELLKLMEEIETISSVWNKAQKESFISSFNELILVLDLLFIVNTIDLKDKLIRKK